MAFCASCGAEMGADVKFCPKCGAPGPGAGASGAAPTGSAGSGPTPSAAPAGAQSAENDNLMGALSYLLIPAIIFLIVEPYNKNRYIRFHSLQALFFALATFVVNITLTILGIILSFVGVGIILFPISMLFSIAVLVMWVICIVKAFQGQEYRLPIIGDIAAQKV